MRPFSRWAVPVAVVAVIATSTALRSAVADSAPTLPARTPAQVLALAAGADLHALSGTITATTDLGLPALPSSMRRDSSGGPSAAALVSRLLGGTTTVRLWVDGPQRVRVQALDQMAETDLVRDGRNVWTYASRTNAATHLVLPDHATGSDHRPAPAPSGEAPTPQALADRLLKAVGPSTAVTLDRPVRVAGRDAYVVRLTPRTDKTLVADATIAVDARTGLPLRVVVDARGRKSPAVDVAFSSLDLGRPAASHFRFTPPAGARVEQRSLPARHGGGQDPSSAPTRPQDSAAGAPRVLGSGWTTVVEAVVPAGAESGSPQLTQLLDAAARPVAGGRMVSTALVSVYLRDDGHVFAGAVRPDVLLAAASGR